MKWARAKKINEDTKKITNETPHEENISGVNVSRPKPSARARQMQTHALAELRQSVWEATQWLSPEETIAYVYDVLREVESDRY